VVTTPTDALGLIVHGRRRDDDPSGLRAGALQLAADQREAATVVGMTPIDDPASALWLARGAVTEDYDGFVLIVPAGPSLAPALATLSASAWIEARRADLELVAGPFHDVVPGQGSYAFVHPMRHLPSQDRRQYQDYWLNEHAKFPARRPQISRYCQLHASATVSEQVRAELGLEEADVDGVALMFTRTIADYIDIIETSNRDGGLDDGGAFYDRASSPSLGLCAVAEAKPRDRKG
jgi:hypothetical protein